MGDNGASQLRGKGTLYEFGIHVPLIVRWPGVVKPGSDASELISGEDLAPTFLEAAGVAAGQGDDRPELPQAAARRAVRGPQVRLRRARAHGSALPTNSASFDLGRCVVSQRYKLIYNALWQIPYTPVDFAGDAFWKELQEMNADGKLSPELSRVYFSPHAADVRAVRPGEATRASSRTSPARRRRPPIERELKAALQEWMILERDFLPLPQVDSPKGHADKPAGGRKRKSPASRGAH